MLNVNHPNRSTDVIKSSISTGMYIGISLKKGIGKCVSQKSQKSQSKSYFYYPKEK